MLSSYNTTNLKMKNIDLQGVIHEDNGIKHNDEANKINESDKIYNQHHKTKFKRIITDKMYFRKYRRTHEKNNREIKTCRFIYYI